MQRMSITATLLLLCCAAGAATTHAQDAVQAVRDLYAAAAYEDALAAVKRMQTDGRKREVEQYRVFSLIALGRDAEARKAMEALISADPSYVLDPAETPPRVQETFREVRQRLLPDVAKGMYLEARGALDRKDRPEAIAQFERLLALIDSAGATAPASVTELKILASGFLDLSRALPEPAPPAPPAAVPTQAIAEPTNVSRAATETRPLALKQELPPWFPSDSLSRRTEYDGSVRVTIGTDGRVTSAAIVRPVHPLYDPALLQAARGWMYEPARQNNVPVTAELTVEVHLRPPQ